MNFSLLSLLTKRHPNVEQKELYARVLCGEVRVDEEIVRNPKHDVDAASAIQFVARGRVSRGGAKLDFAMDAMDIDPTGLVVLDAGSSTGGFTEALLVRGAAFVHAVDVGYNQLAWSLRKRPDVGVRERTNIMSVTRLAPVPDFATVDLSFRSLRGAASHILGLTREKRAIALVKPQFEWIDPPDSFDGVVREESDLISILSELIVSLSGDGVDVEVACESPITGRSGNREFLFLLQAADRVASVVETRIIRGDGHEAPPTDADGRDLSIGSLDGGDVSNRLFRSRRVASVLVYEAKEARESGSPT